VAAVSAAAAFVRAIGCGAAVGLAFGAVLLGAFILGVTPLWDLFTVKH